MGNIGYKNLTEGIKGGVPITAAGANFVSGVGAWLAKRQPGQTNDAPANNSTLQNKESYRNSSWYARHNIQSQFSPGWRGGDGNGTFARSKKLYATK